MKWISVSYDGKTWNGFTWLKIGTRKGCFETGQYNLKFNKVRRICYWGISYLQGDFHVPKK
jgi:hypothetical protein